MEISRAQVKEHSKKKKPKKKDKPINLADLEIFIGMCEYNKKKFIPPLDYDYSITRSFEKRKAGSSSDDAQLGAQKKQSIEPLIVLNEKQGLISLVKTSKLTTAQRVIRNSGRSGVSMGI